MKAKHWIAAGLCIATGLALFAGDAQATDEESSYRFRLANLRITLSAYIRCESSDEWRRVPVGMSRDISCSEPDAETKVEGKVTNSHTHNCAPDPVMRIEYKLVRVGGRRIASMSRGCRSS